jgi:transposase
VADLFENICTHNRKKILKNIMVHLDDARPHNSRKSTEYLEQFGARRVPHPAYSPYLAPNDFFLFGHMKSKLPGLAIRSREDLICEIRRIFKDIPKVIFIFIYIS